MRQGLHTTRFGGMYADLDFECMRSMTDLLSDVKGAVLGRMGIRPTFDHSIPNAWMASTPGHGFWLFAASLVGCRWVESHTWVESQAPHPTQIQQRLHGAVINLTEYKTGPIMLFDAYNAWQRMHTEDARGVGEPVVLLEPGTVYPIDWSLKAALPELCRPENAAFDPVACKKLFPDAYAITYCMWGCSCTWFHAVCVHGPSYNTVMINPLQPPTGTHTWEPQHVWLGDG